MSEPRATPATRLLVLVGGIALLLAAATDAVAVIGRHLGRPLLGSIEVIQAAVLVASSVALVIATAERRHAVVHLLVNRLPPGPRNRIGRAGAALGALLAVALLAGAIWIARDMWDGHEESELLRIPYAPLRLIEIAALAATAGLWTWQAIRGARR